MNTDEKQCPMCAETVKAAAKVCKHCGNKFSETSDTPPQPILPGADPRPPAKRTWLSKLSFIALILFVVAGIRLGVQISRDLPATSSPEMAAQSADISVTATELSADYQANEVAAQQKYGGKKLEISGEISKIRLNFRDHPTLYLNSGVLLPVQAEFDPSRSDDLAKLQVGESVTVYCSSISEVIAEPLARDCELSSQEVSK
jgi:hypothetical protein